MIKLLLFLSPIFGFVGTVLLAFFGIPNNLGLEKGFYLVVNNKDHSKRNLIFKIFSNLGLLLIALSFAFQLIIVIKQNDLIYFLSNIFEK